jgi:recombination protein RecR
MNIDSLSSLFTKLPGIGPRSARRLVLYLIKHKESLMLPLANGIKSSADTIKECKQCGNYDESEVCSICSDHKREQNIICVVETALELWAFERGKIFKGLYHVLGGCLSAGNGIRPSDLAIERLVERCRKESIKEVIIATNATMDGQTTAYYISDRLKDIPGVKISRLAYGMPVGGELDYLDESTIEAALESRKQL